MGGGGGGQRGGHPGDFSSAFSDVFDDLFGNFGGGGMGGGRNRAQRGNDLRYNLRINLEDAFKGMQRPSTSQQPYLVARAKARAQRAAQSPSLARPVLAWAKCAHSRASLRLNAHVQPVTAWAKRSRTPANPATAKGVSRKKSALRQHPCWRRNWHTHSSCR